MGKKPTTFTEKDHKNYEEADTDFKEALSVPEAEDGTNEPIWSADKARKVAGTYETRNFKKGLRDVMRYVKTAANSGQYECTVYKDNVTVDINIDSIARSLAERGYTVKKCEQANGWYVKISW